jgi:hypothetical protein
MGVTLSVAFGDPNITTRTYEDAVVRVKLRCPHRLLHLMASLDLCRSRIPFGWNLLIHTAIGAAESLAPYDPALGCGIVVPTARATEGWLSLLGWRGWDFGREPQLVATKIFTTSMDLSCPLSTVVTYFPVKPSLAPLGPDYPAKVWVGWWREAPRRRKNWLTPLRFGLRHGVSHHLLVLQPIVWWVERAAPLITPTVVGLVAVLL